MFPATSAPHSLDQSRRQLDQWWWGRLRAARRHRKHCWHTRGWYDVQCCGCPAERASVGVSDDPYDR